MRARHVTDYITLRRPSEGNCDALCHHQDGYRGYKGSVNPTALR